MATQIPDPGYTPDSFTAAFAAKVRAAHPELKVEVNGPLHLTVEHPDGGQHALSLEHPWTDVRQGADAEEALERFLTTMVAAGPPKVPEGPALHAALRPVVKHIDYVRAVFEQVGQGEVPVFGFVGELYIMLVADLGQSMAVVSSSQLQKAAIAPKDALLVALQNLANDLNDVAIHGDRLRMFQAGGNYEASLLLLGSIWEQLAEKMQGAPIAVPLARDLLVFTDGGDPEAVAELRAFVERTREEGLSYAISEAVLAWNGGGWRLLDAPPEA
ncbi:MAG: hypothetical protein H6702_20290 [Myxococcales bacterium]|nr:hypothetical protein [Myxococcales bacterium]